MKYDYDKWMAANEKDMFWRSQLASAIDSLQSGLLDDISNWDSLIVNKRKPHTYRAFHFLESGVRICLHRFTTCEASDAFPHPHPWPGAFTVLDGRYLMHVGMSSQASGEPSNVITTELGVGSVYVITNPLTWHSVQPLTECYSIMVNGVPFENQHENAPTTKGKDLDKMTSSELQEHLNKFKIRIR